MQAVVAELAQDFLTKTARHAFGDAVGPAQNLLPGNAQPIIQGPAQISLGPAALAQYPAVFWTDHQNGVAQAE